MNTTIINPLRDDAWDRLVLRHPDCNFFHSTAWARVLTATYRHTPVYLSISDDQGLGALVPMMEVRSPLTGLRGVGLPFTDSCHPLLFGMNGLEQLLGCLSDLARERHWKHFELRARGNPMGHPEPCYYEHTVELGGCTEELFARFSSANRRAIRKAEKSSVSISTAKSKQAMVEYYKLHLQTRRRHGLPPQPYSFFQNIQKLVIEPGLGFVVLAYLGGSAIAGAIYFHFGKKAVYKFGASDDRFQQYRGNNLVMWNAIQILARGRFEQLHLGRSSCANEGLRKFKESWGATERPLAYFKRDMASGKWIKERDRCTGIHNLLFANLPLALNQLAGTMIYPHMD